MNRNKLKIQSALAVIGAALDKGAGVDGASKGPGSIRANGVIAALSALGYDVRDTGDVVMPLSGSTPHPRLKNLTVVNSVNTGLYNAVAQALSQGAFPLVLGGDHALAAGSVSAAQKHYGKIGLIWVDAHGDYNSAESSPSGNIHGMPMSALTGYGPDEILPFKDKSAAFVAPQNTVLIAARDLDPQEKLRLIDAGVTVFTMADIDRIGIHGVVAESLKIATQDTAGVYVSFDLDALDPSVAPGVSTPVPGGLTYREARVLCEAFAASGKLIGAEMVELNPLRDENSRTARVAVDMIATLMGKTLI